ncbi:Uncharacterized protein Fot_08621 [Forsythia ovata]|uniref:Uncharacterized protein n=1 Tax=Forsythia ovata TaxID=205694 RepID=A0ABD1WZN5_9LAMI
MSCFPSDWGFYSEICEYQCAFASVLSTISYDTRVRYQFNRNMAPFFSFIININLRRLKLCHECSSRYCKRMKFSQKSLLKKLRLCRKRLYKGVNPILPPLRLRGFEMQG